jgi:hypothetical protein
MSTLGEIEQAVEKLGSEERAQLFHWITSRFEDELDLLAHHTSMNEPGVSTSLEDVKSEFGLA